MNWSTPAELRQQVLRWWDKGTILAALAGDASIFPKRLTLKAPSSAELLDHFESVRGWSQTLREMPHIRLEMREFRHRVFGANSLPAEAWVDDHTGAVALIGKQKETRLFGQILASTASRQPTLRAWLSKRPLRALELADAWPRLLDIVDWLLTHPRPGIYLRQMDIGGVPSKFVEAHRGVLIELLDLALPAEAIDPSASGSSRFCQRYGFLDKPERIRLRWLDPINAPICSQIPALAQADLTLDAATFTQLNPTVDQVFITENETNFLAFPAVNNALIIFGAGYGFSALKQARWLHDCHIHYWGDIDTHGFAILDELRSHFPHAESLLMDSETLLAHEPLWGSEETPSQRELSRLSPAEQAIYNDLRDNRLRINLRLEQERISFGWLQNALLSLAPAS
jgi:hypothetical protein